MEYNAIKGYLLLKGFLFESNYLCEYCFSKSQDIFIHFSADTKRLLEIHYYCYRDVNITEFKNIPFTLSKDKIGIACCLKLYPPVYGSVYINNGLYFKSEEGKSFPIKLNSKDFLNYLNTTF